MRDFGKENRVSETLKITARLQHADVAVICCDGKEIGDIIHEEAAAEVARRINHAEQLAEQLEYDADSFRGELHDLEHGTLGEFGISILRYRLKRIDAALASYRANGGANAPTS